MANTNQDQNCIICYDKKKLTPPPSILVTIDGISITKVNTKGVLRIIIDGGHSWQRGPALSISR